MEHAKLSVPEQHSVEHTVREPLSDDCSAIIRYRAEVAIAWIKEDIRLGIQPASVKTFSDLHDCVDANMYLLDEDHINPRVGSFWEWEELDVQGVCDQFNAVIVIINDWLATRAYVMQNHG